MVITNQMTRWPGMVLGLLAGCLLLAPVGWAAQVEKSRKETANEPSKAELEEQLAVAQRRLEEAAREVADLSMSISGDMLPRMARTSSVMLGVNVGWEREAGRTDGVEVMGVSPGGAAAEAGIKTGDVLVELAGKSLTADAGGSPRTKLFAVMRGVDPEEKIQLKYLRDGKPSVVTVAPQRADNLMYHFNTMAPPPPPGAPHALATPFGRVSGAFGNVLIRAESVFGSAELVPLTPKLGQYFGTEKGLLVVRAPDDARLKLEDGDVIMDIDGRVPSSPTHAMRILGTYQAGEKLKLNVMRSKQRKSFDVEIPKD